MSPEDKELQRLEQRDHVSKHSMCVCGFIQGDSRIVFDLFTKI
jgi:hypothetical protein